MSDTLLRVRDEVVLVWFDLLPPTELVGPLLTAVAQHPERLAAKAADRLAKH